MVRETAEGEEGKWVRNSGTVKTDNDSFNYSPLKNMKETPQVT